MLIEFHESCQFALFLRGPGSPSALELWGLGFDTQPTGFQTLPDQRTTQVQGTFHGNEIVLVAQANRIDVHLQGVGNVRPEIAEPDKSIEAVHEAIAKMLSRLHVGRAAAVLQGGIYAPNSKEASKLIPRYVPGLPCPPETEDLTYALIVRRPAEHDPTRIVGQIARWSALAMQFVQITSTGPQSASPPQWVAHAHIDVFTEGLLVLDAAAALGELRFVTERAKAILRGGVNEL